MRRVWLYTVSMALAGALFTAVMLIAGTTARGKLADADTRVLDSPWPLDGHPLAILYLAGPFLLLAALGVRIRHTVPWQLVLALFIAGSAWLCWLYYTNVQDSVGHLNREAWTASALAIGLLPPKGAAGIVGAVLLMLWLCDRRRD